MIESSGDFVVLNVGKYGVMPTDSISNTSSNSGGTINLSLFEKAKQKLSRGGEKGLTKHSMDNGTGKKPQHTWSQTLHRAPALVIYP